MFAAKLLPTASLYLLDAVDADKNLRLRRISRHTYVAPSGTGVVVRYASPEKLSSLRAYCYVVDDDFQAIVEDSNQPEGYRQRIARFVQNDWQKIVEGAQTIVVPNEQLMQKYQRMGCQVHMLHPYWKTLDESHSGPLVAQRPFEIGWLATRSHNRDLEAIIRHLFPWLKEHEDQVQFTTLAGDSIPESLNQLSCVQNLRGKPWQTYQKWLSRQRFDLVLNPLLNTEVNQNRSFSKLGEIGTTRAIPLFSDIPPWNKFFGDSNREFLIGKVDDWPEAINRLFLNASKRVELQQKAFEMAVAFNHSAKVDQIAYWTKQL